MTMILLLSALAFCGAGAWMVIRKLRCQKEITAVFLENDGFATLGFSSYSPVFKYEFEGREYQGETFETFSKHRVAGRFEKGQEYRIFINQKKPGDFVISHSIRPIEALLIVLGFAAEFLFCLQVMG